MLLPVVPGNGCPTMTANLCLSKANALRQLAQERPVVPDAEAAWGDDLTSPPADNFLRGKANASPGLNSD